MRFSRTALKGFFCGRFMTVFGVLLLFLVSISFIHDSYLQRTAAHIIVYSDELSLRCQKYRDNNKKESKYLIETAGCRIPQYEVCPLSMEPYFKYGYVFDHCDMPDYPPLTTSKRNVLYFHSQNMASYISIEKHNLNFNATNSLQSFLDRISVTCCFYPILRITQSKHNYDNDCDKRWRYGPECIPITHSETVVPDYDGIFVKCYRWVTFYENVHHLVQRKTLTRVGKVPSLGEDEITSRNGDSNSIPDDQHSSSLPELSVIIFGTDSVSRYNFLRSNPMTYNYLMKELNAFDFKGFNKVADNTFPNLVSTLTGLTDEELLSHTCQTNSEGASGGAMKFDDCPFIWKDFQRKGYATAFFEDTPWMAMFHYFRTGFVEQPTDHYGRPSFIVSDLMIGRSGDKMCQRDKLSLEVIHDYSLDLMDTYRNESSFSLLWCTALTHDTLNYALYADEPHHRYLKALKEGGALNRSILFFVSDHGMRFGSFRETLLGKVEENMPYLFVVVPDWFRDRFPEAISNMERNTNVLTSPFDIYATMQDILNENYENESHVSRTPSTHRGISLFQEVSPKRSCLDIGIPNEYCTCREYIPMKNPDQISSQVEIFMMGYMNTMLEPFPKCHPIDRVKVKKIFIVNEDSDDSFSLKNNKNLFVQMSYSPGDALIEATLLWGEGRFVSQQFQVDGEISRINRYGNQSHCIRHNEMRKFCICNDTLMAQ